MTVWVSCTESTRDPGGVIGHACLSFIAVAMAPARACGGMLELLDWMAARNWGMTGWEAPTAMRAASSSWVRFWASLLKVMASVQAVAPGAGVLLAVAMVVAEMVAERLLRVERSTMPTTAHESEKTAPWMVPQAEIEVFFGGGLDLQLRDGLL